MDDDKDLVHASPSFQEQVLSSLASLKQKLWPLVIVDTCEQSLDDSISNDRIVHALESLLNENISCSQLQNEGKLSITSIAHCQQLDEWDCGIACLLMVMRWLSPVENIKYSSEVIHPEEKRLRETLVENIGAKSIWTADLVLELHRLLLLERDPPVADYVFCSKNMGVDESYQNFGYYRDNFAKDQGRVKDAFIQLAKCSPSCFSSSHLPLALVINAVSHPNCIAIALVDNNKLHECRSTSVNDDEYVGHYVIVCGCSSDPHHVVQAREQNAIDYESDEDRCLTLVNPAQDSSPTMYVLPSRFERSWRASGTDDDIVFVIRQ